MARLAFSMDFPTQLWMKLRKRHWLVIILLTLLWHFLVFVVPWNRLIFSESVRTPSPRIDLTPIDTQKLEQIRKSWRDQSKQLLLKKDNLPAAKEAAKDARYMSDKNVIVEKEQRARQTDVMPKPGAAGVPGINTTAPQSPKATNAQPQVASPKSSTPSLSQPTPLSRLGVPFHLRGRITENRPRPAVPRTIPAPTPGGAVGADQALHDEKLPQGAENMLNTQESIYYSYYARLYEAVGPVWQSLIREVPGSKHIPQGVYQTDVEVYFDEDGNVALIKFLRSSGIREFDEAVTAAWKRTNRYPNPPRALLDGERKVKTGWSFFVNVGSGFNIDYLPPQRRY